MRACRNTENIARLRPTSNTAFNLVEYGTQKPYIFPYSTRACVITYIVSMPCAKTLKLKKSSFYDFLGHLSASTIMSRIAG